MFLAEKSSIKEHVWPDQECWLIGCVCSLRSLLAGYWGHDSLRVVNQLTLPQTLSWSPQAVEVLICWCTTLNSCSMFAVCANLLCSSNTNLFCINFLCRFCLLLFWVAYSANHSSLFYHNNFLLFSAHHFVLTRVCMWAFSLLTDRFKGLLSQLFCWKSFILHFLYFIVFALVGQGSHTNPCGQHFSLKQSSSSGQSMHLSV